MTIKEIIFSTLQDRFSEQNIHKVLITKNVIDNVTSIQCEFKDDRETIFLQPNKTESKTLDLILISKIKKAIINFDKSKKEIYKIFIYINIVSEEIDLCYQYKDESNINVFNN